MDKIDELNGKDKQETIGSGDSGWIEWRGSDVAPVDSVVEVKLRDGRKEEGQADWWGWEHIQSPGDILAYRVIKE